ncbi:MAG: hypothetical protein AUK47_00105 [Deltaproteobacteria bacterium CG2_30_63_29]|nr:MAG: hypothetical protein AUK47_00105 [Deltaproteobacteria bacterium CG2_30_63_29]PIV99032.1 MAG: hypothetical protein COW42_12385 [Deltaproteobacteria bacterium CG17_big_fil_post_rev_8_21_14_2_50_63_7]PJB34314.1 MAG: hypothetical protein CO108_28525 [Deltaproteobacteria bacterium CG_4_9_14_3_um_filter_63_12]
MSSRYESYDRSIDDLDFTADRLMEVLQETESTAGMQMDSKRIEEASKLMGQSELQIERFNDLEHHRVKDYHVWSLKNPHLIDEVVEEMMHSREALKDSTDQLEAILGRMRGLEKHVASVKESYENFAEHMQTMMQSAGELGLSTDYTLRAVQQKIIPDLERMLYQLERTITSFAKELEERLAQLDFIGRQIAWLRGGSVPIRKVKDDSEEEPPEEEAQGEQPTQAEALVDHQDEQIEAYSVESLDRGRSDERKRGRGRGSKGGPK